MMNYICDRGGLPRSWSFGRKYFAKEETTGLSEPTILEATAAIISEEKKKVIFDTVVALNTYFKKASMRERCGLLASYSGNPDPAAQMNTARIFINMLKGAITTAGLYFIPKFEVFQKTAQMTDNTITGTIFTTKYMDPWSLIVNNNNNTFTDLKDSSITISVGRGTENYTYKPYSIDGDQQTLGSADDLYRTFFRFIVRVCHRELLITDKDIEASGVVL